jgi:exopolysaccharide biosynthesis polyprenyl glycosylphosphotransferase
MPIGRWVTAFAEHDDEFRHSGCTQALPVRHLRTRARGASDSCAARGGEDVDGPASQMLRVVPTPREGDEAAGHGAEAAFALSATGDGSRGSIVGRRRHRQMSAVLVLTDLVALSCSMLIGWVAVHRLSPQAARGSLLTTYVLIALAVLAGLAIQGAYRLRGTVGIRYAHLRVAMQALLPSVALAVMFDSAFRRGSPAPFDPIAALFMVLPIPVLLPALRSAALVGWHKGTRQPERILILGSGPVAERVAKRLGRSSGVTVVGMVDDDAPPGELVLGRLDDLPTLCAVHHVDRVLDAFPRAPSHHTAQVLRRVQGQVAVSMVPRLHEMLSWRSTLDELEGMPLTHVAPRQVTRTALAAKRLMDTVGAMVGLVLLSPLFIAIAIAIKATSPGPVLFRQLRTGRNGRPFKIWKFRTMYLGAEERRGELADQNEADGPIFKMGRDPRETPAGRILRRTSLDELPQLVNVLRGEMSLVGPRPFPVDESAQIAGQAAARFHVRPGITGLWQVSGRNELTYEDLCDLDSVYVASWSLSWDMRILLQTPRCVLRRHGVL